MYENDETMVEEEDFDTEADDTLQEGVEEEAEDESEDLDSLTEEDGEEEEEQQADDDYQEQQASEPGWIKRRVQKAVDKAVAQALAQQQEEFDRQMAPIREKMLNDEARDLVRQGEFKSLDRAKEYLRLKQGLPVQQQAEPQPQPRNERGQYAPTNDPATQARIDMLAHQADTIKEETGVDVIKVFQTNPDIKDAVVSGDMDFYDVAREMQQKRRPPAPMRSPNGASGQNYNAITTMSDEQFERMERRISEGKRYSLK